MKKMPTSRWRLAALTLAFVSSLFAAVSYASANGGFFVMDSNQSTGKINCAYYSGAIHNGATPEQYYQNLTTEQAENLFNDMECDLMSVKLVDDKFAEQ